MDKIQDVWQRLTVPVMKSKRELIADIYFSFVGIVVAIMAFKIGGGIAIAGGILIAMLVILFFIPE